MSWLTSAAHSRWLESETDRMLAFGAAARRPDGFAWLDDAGRPDLERPIELWITARMTHVYALAHLMGRPGAGALADHGVGALAGPFRDDVNGGWYAALGPDASGAKTAYEHAFVLLAAASATAARRPGAAALLEDALAIHDRHFWDEDAGAVVEEWDRTFIRLDGYRGANANMHTVEALLAVADVVDDGSRLRERALRICTRIVHEQAAANSWRIPEHYTETWTPVLDFNRDQPAHPFRPYGATVGHGFEWARLCLHLAAALGDHAPAWLVDDARSLFATAARDGWGVDGGDGFVYTVDWEGAPVVRERMHWVVTEAIAAAAALHRVTGEDSYARQYETWWDSAAEHVIDPAGSWRHELDASNQPASGTWSGKPDIYHVVQATLLPRLPLAPALAVALRDGLLR